MNGSDSSHRKAWVGVVVSNKMKKTVVVAVEWRQIHPLYGKPMRRYTRLKAHDNEGVCQQGDVVRLAETRPLSKTKHWRVVEVLKKAEQFELRPEEVSAPIIEGEVTLQASVPEEATAALEGAAGASLTESKPGDEAASPRPEARLEPEADKEEGR